jgi:hypothetical protein
VIAAIPTQRLAMMQDDPILQRQPSRRGGGKGPTIVATPGSATRLGIALRVDRDDIRDGR